MQTGAIIYLIYRVHRLEQMLNGGRSARRERGGNGDSKVIPLLKEHLPPGPFKGKPNPPDPKR